MKRDYYHLNKGGYISYSIEFSKSDVQLTLHFRHGSPENIIFETNSRNFKSYKGYKRSRRKYKAKPGKSELKEEFLEGLEAFLENLDNIHIGKHQKSELLSKIQKLYKDIK